MDPAKFTNRNRRKSDDSRLTLGEQNVGASGKPHAEMRSRGGSSRSFKDFSVFFAFFETKISSAADTAAIQRDGGAFRVQEIIGSFRILLTAFAVELAPRDRRHPKGVISLRRFVMHATSVSVRRWRTA